MAHSTTSIYGLQDIPWPVEKRSAPTLQQFITRSLDGLPVSLEEVTPQTALKLAAVNACIRIISVAVASMPLNTLSLSDNIWQKDDTHYLYPLFAGRVNSFLTGHMWKLATVNHMATFGNAFSQIIFNKRMQVMELHLLDPSRMTVEMKDGALIYKYRQQNQTHVIIPPDEVLHNRWPFSTDGFTGRSPIEMGSDAIMLGLQSQWHTSNFFRNGATMGPIVKVPTSYDSEKSKHFEEAFGRRHQGTNNAHMPLFLYGGMELTPQAINFEQLQLIQLKHFCVEEISRYFGVPSHMINLAEPGSSKANVEQQALEFATNTLKPIVESIEAEINTALLSPRERTQIKVQFDLDNYTRADFATRMKGYQLATGNNQWMSVNDVRAKENLPSVEGGDTIYTLPGAAPLVTGEDDETTDPDAAVDDAEE